MGLVITTADAEAGSAGRLVGRVQERRLLDGLIESAEGGGAAALIVGEAGTGKTALLTYVAEVASSRVGLRVLRARGEDGRWIGGSVQQWIDELITAVLDYHAAGFIYRSTDDTPADEALARWATEIVPAVREAITR